MTVTETPAEPRDFSWALRCIKSGHRLRRRGWGETGFHVELHHGIENKGMDDSEIVPFLLIGTADGVYAPWPIPNCDALAEDWELL